MTDPLDGLPLMAAPEPQMPPPASAPGADAEVETLRARVRSQRVARDAASVIENPKTGNGGGGNSSKLPLLGKLTSMLSGAGKMGKKKWLVVGVVGVVLIVIGVAAMFVWPMIFGGGEFSAAPTVSAPVFVEPSPGPAVVQPTAPRSGWDYTFKVPQSRSEWGLGIDLGDARSGHPVLPVRSAAPRRRMGLLYCRRPVATGDVDHGGGQGLCCRRGGPVCLLGRQGLSDERVEPRHDQYRLDVYVGRRLYGRLRWWRRLFADW